MADGIDSKIDSQTVTDVSIMDLSGSKEAATLLLESIGEKMPLEQLKLISFSDWQGSTSEVPTQSLSQIAEKAKVVESLQVMKM